MKVQASSATSVESSHAHREWLASIDLQYQSRRGKSSLIGANHTGPLRVQRPFYPEADGTCHTYLLHPPGGMAVGDKLAIAAKLDANTSVLLTTPSAGKMYGTKGVENAALMPQVQNVRLECAEGTMCEWLPQETIIFDAAQAKIDTKIELSADAKFIGWDIIRLGRVASGERFSKGYCHQNLRCYREGKLIFRELNLLEASSKLMDAKWGLQSANTLATMLCTAELDREQVDRLYELLPADQKNAWGLSQKGSLFIARYLGTSILDCRAGLQCIWHFVRPLIAGKNACDPRIWNT